MAGTFTSLNYHVIFSTKDRFPFINSDLQSRLYEYIGGIIRSESGILLEIGGIADHLHLLFRCRPTPSLSDQLRVIKSKSSGWVHENFPKLEKFAWQDGYGAFTVSKSDLVRVSDYIRNQEEHHRTKTFKDEFVRFLQVHELEYDERYIWK